MIESREETPGVLFFIDFIPFSFLFQLCIFSLDAFYSSFRLRPGKKTLAGGGGNGIDFDIFFLYTNFLFINFNLRIQLYCVKVVLGAGNSMFIIQIERMLSSINPPFR